MSPHWEASKLPAREPLGGRSEEIQSIAEGSWKARHMGVDKLEGSEMALCQLSGFQFLHLLEFTFLFQLLRSLLFVPTEVQMVASGNKILQDICVLPVISSS